MSDRPTPMTDAEEKRYAERTAPAWHVQPIFDYARRLERMAAQLAERLEDLRNEVYYADAPNEMEKAGEALAEYNKMKEELT